RGYRLDATGRVLSVLSGGAGRAVETDEAYRYTRNGLPQDTARLTEWQAGRLTQHDDTHYQYDKAGRLIRKQVVQPGYRPQVWNYRWDSRNQLRVVDTPTGERWFYRYDPFGRRTGKRCEQTQDDIRCLWDGDQIAEVRHYRSGERVARRHWVHNGWELLVQQRQNADGRRETDFVTSSQNGEPQALYRPDSTLRWQAPKSTLWGQRPGSAEDPADPGLGFAGQYRDTESGLCYNRFRYYDPAGGCYISPDPIGVLGGESNYGYVHNPVCWVDPFGLAGCSVLDDIIKDANKVASTGGGITSKQAQILRNNLPVIQRRTVFQNQMARKEFVKNQDYLMRQWEANMGMSWPKGATPHHIIPLESGGANKWWNLMPTNGTLPNHSLPGIPGPHAAGGTLRTTIQQGRKALPPGTITDLRLPYG
ncbi:RHS repeat-associated core domain-containing protein, partial [Pectobacterium carotovorum]|uniref:RHS repeat-associated core domain-containing protein n=1 Tax=Pectobacterium carotovorum TaxID=554 RepID=UPI0030174022